MDGLTERLGAAAELSQNPVMNERFVIRPDQGGFSVCDMWTGEAAIIAMTPQTGLSQEDAEHTAELLNRRATAGDRAAIQ